MKLSDVTFTVSTTGKITVAHYAGIDVEAMYLQGTLLSVQTFCSTSTWNMLLRWIGGRDAPNLDKGNQFFSQSCFAWSIIPMMNGRWMKILKVSGMLLRKVWWINCLQISFGRITLPIALAKRCLLWYFNESCFCSTLVKRVLAMIYFENNSVRS